MPPSGPLVGFLGADIECNDRLAKSWLSGIYVAFVLGVNFTSYLSNPQSSEAVDIGTVPCFVEDTKDTQDSHRYRTRVLRLEEWRRVPW